jgi:hypothetical protein
VITTVIIDIVCTGNPDVVLVWTIPFPLCNLGMRSLVPSYS